MSPNLIFSLRCFCFSSLFRVCVARLSLPPYLLLTLLIVHLVMFGCYR